MSDADVLRPTWRPRALPLRLRSDERLARRAARGDTDAFAVLYERHHAALYRYCRSIVSDPDDASDALQSTMTRALAAIGVRDQRAPLRAWLFRIAHNESISLVRGRRTTGSLDPESLIGPDVEVDAERRHRLAQLVSDLHALSERQRGALVMRELSGLGHAEIAAALEMSEGAVKQTIYEARTALHDFAAGREMTCASVRRQLSDGDGRTARNRRLRAHLRSCDACGAFRAELRARRSELAAIAPMLPAATAAAVLESVIGGGGIGGGGLLVGLLGGAGLSKTVAVGAATVTAGASAVTYTAVATEETPTPPDAPPPAEAAPDKPPPAAVVAVPDESRKWAAQGTDSEPRAEEPRVEAVRPERRAASGERPDEVEDEPHAAPPPERVDVPFLTPSPSPAPLPSPSPSPSPLPSPSPSPLPVAEVEAGQPEADDDGDDQSQGVPVTQPEPSETDDEDGDD
jgi:RNA polymerase sigma factor (sigma-70 family)